MPGGTKETHVDDSPLATGTHKRGASSATLVDPGADFLSCGIHGNTGKWGGADQQLVKNTTDGSSALITAVTEDEVTAALTGGTDNDWDVGDEYEIYVTEEEDSVISSVWVDKSRGWRSDKQQLDRGWRPEDVDLDRDDSRVWGPGQPEKRYDGK